MFYNWSMIEIYCYLEFLFFSLTLSLIIKKVGIEPLKIIWNEVKNYVEKNKSLDKK